MLRQSSNVVLIVVVLLALAPVAQAGPQGPGHTACLASCETTYEQQLRHCGPHPRPGPNTCKGRANGEKAACDKHCPS
jgi:hypothetical protein